MQIMFETFNVPAFYIVSSEIMSLYAHGRKMGIAVDIGHDKITSVVLALTDVQNISPDGSTAVNTLTLGNSFNYNIGGKDLTDYLMKILTKRDCNFANTAEREIVRDIKEKLFYVAQNFDEEIENAKTSSLLEKSYKLANGKVIIIGSERFRCPEVLFHPSLASKESKCVHKLVHQCIAKCDLSSKKICIRILFLQVAAVCFQGIAERLTKEITQLAPAGTEVELIAPPERKYSAWIGGSTMANLSTFQNMWITKAEYNQFGSAIVHQKCWDTILFLDVF